MEMSGNVNQELLRIDDDNDEDDNMSVDHMGQLFWGVWAIFARKILRQHPNNCLSNLTKQQVVDERKLFKL